MKNFKHQFGLNIILCLVFFVSCQKDPKTSTGSVTTDSVTNITANAATINGNVTNDGGSTITERGVCWKTSSNPTINDNKISEGKGTGPFTSSITGLMPKTTYYVKAFTTNSNGTAYSNQLSFTTAIPSVTISTQQWTLNNLDVTTYRNGDIIPQVTDNAQWAGLTTGAWCYYNNDSANGAVYGKLYNWYAVNDARGLAPLGWHIPSKEEWITLTTFLGGDGLAGGKMKATTLWNSPNTGATNESGFTGLPGGYRDGTGPSITIGNNGRWWTTKEHDSTTAVERSLGYNIGDCYMYYLDKRCGMSVRCVKD